MQLIMRELDTVPRQEVEAAPKEDDADAGGAWIENRPSATWRVGVDVRELWRYRELVRLFAIRDVKLRYKQTFFGVAWAIIQPLAAIAIFSGIFGAATDIPSDGLPYAVFVAAAMVFWTYFASATSAAASSLVEDRALITKVYFPRLVAPLAAVLAGLVDLAISLVLVGVLVAAYGVGVSAALLIVPLWALGTVVVATAAGLWLSALNVIYRDVRYALPFVLQIWFFASPVVFPSSLVHGGWRFVFYLNPMAAIIDGARWSLAGGPAPDAIALVGLASGLALLAGGIAYFRSAERSFADLI